jgi:hypothetical protein
MEKGKFNQDYANYFSCGLGKRQRGYQFLVSYDHHNFKTLIMQNMCMEVKIYVKNQGTKEFMVRR